MNGLISTFSHGPSKRIEFVNNTVYFIYKTRQSKWRMASTSRKDSLAAVSHIRTILLDLSYLKSLPLLLNTRDKLCLRWWNLFHTRDLSSLHTFLIGLKSGELAGHQGSRIDLSWRA
jgi:hypothetical protein